MAFLSSEARFGPFLDTVKHKADPVRHATHCLDLLVP